MAWWLRALIDLPEVQALILSNHMMAQQLSKTPVPEDLMPSSGLQMHCMHIACIQSNLQAKHPIYNKNQNENCA